jgi:hypothetical protein
VAGQNAEPPPRKEMLMAILVRRKGGAWEKVGEKTYTDESHLQQMLYESPELIRTPDEKKPPLVFIKEAGLLGSGSTDLLGVDANGEIYIVECKRAVNPDIKRKVIGQVLEYGAKLWNEDYENFSDRFLKKEKKSLEELLRKKKLPDDWSFENFQSRAAQNLKSGSFHLIVVVDKMNEGLRRIIDYVRSRQADFNFEGLELSLFKQGEVEILVPNSTPHVQFLHYHGRNWHLNRSS